MPRKPTSKLDLLPPFERIDEPGWNGRLTSFLTSFDVPLAIPCGDADIEECENRLHSMLPQSLRIFLTTIGPQTFDYLTVFNPADIRIPDEWFVESMRTETREQLHKYIRVADAGGSGDVFAVEISTESVHFVSHDPLGIHPIHASFDDLIREYCIDIFTGYYGWPDEEIEEMAHELRAELFPQAEY